MTPVFYFFIYFFRGTVLRSLRTLEYAFRHIYQFAPAQLEGYDTVNVLPVSPYDGLSVVVGIFDQTRGVAVYIDTAYFYSGIVEIRFAIGERILPIVA